MEVGSLDLSALALVSACRCKARDPPLATRPLAIAGDVDIRQNAVLLLGDPLAVDAPRHAHAAALVPLHDGTRSRSGPEGDATPRKFTQKWHLRARNPAAVRVRHKSLGKPVTPVRQGSARARGRAELGPRARSRECRNYQYFFCGARIEHRRSKTVVHMACAHVTGRRGVLEPHLATRANRGRHREPAGRRPSQ